MTCSRAALLMFVAALGGSAQSITPSAYSMPNGKLGPGGLLYRDDLYKGTGDRSQDGAELSAGLGQLSDGMTGCGDDPTADCGSGPGYPWVGWRSDPVITFEFGTYCDFNTVRIFTVNRPDAPLWASVTISFSDDGLRFRNDRVWEPTDADRANHSARYIDIPVRATARVVRLQFARANPQAWVLISDVAFGGRISKHQVQSATPR